MFSSLTVMIVTEVDSVEFVTLSFKPFNGKMLYAGALGQL